VCSAGIDFGWGLLFVLCVFLWRNVVATLTQTMFISAAVRALAATGGDVEAALDRLARDTGAQTRKEDKPSPSPELAQLVSMGYDRGAAARALSESGNNVERAVEKLIGVDQFDIV
jgi:uncharacterized UBP type Zn finger protein